MVHINKFWQGYDWQGPNVCAYVKTNPMGEILCEFEWKIGQKHVEMFEMSNRQFPPFSKIWSRNSC